MLTPPAALEHTPSPPHAPRGYPCLPAQVKPAQAPATILDPADAPEPAPEDDGDDVILATQPKRANFDLQRDVSAKLLKLDRRTQRAMFDLARAEEERRLKESAAPS